MELFNKEGHLTDEGLRAVVDGTLDEIHFKQKQLDRLDYLRFEIAQSNKDK